MMSEKQFSKEIDKRKRKLKRKAQKSGLYENFGRKEIAEMQDMISLEEWYSNNPKSILLKNFMDWCHNIDLSKI